MMKPKVICIAGPTASGKSAIGMALAEKLQGEIIGMDSMQIYRQLDIGTAKPTKEEQAQIPHHLVDIRDPQESYTVAQYVEDASAAINDISSRGMLPIMVGGTGFYLQALMHGLHLGSVPSDPALRLRLKAEAQDADGRKKLHDKLQAVDPEAAQRLHENDITRVSRALEVYLLTGIPLSKQEQPAFDSPFDFCIIGTALERSALYNRINSRVDQMIKDGLPDEVKALLDAGISPQAQSMQGIGYKELIPAILGEYPLEKAVYDLKRNTRHYAKRQLTWFKREEHMHWLDMADAQMQQKAQRLVQNFLEGYVE